MATRVRLDENFPVLKRKGFLRHRVAEQWNGRLEGRAYMWPASKTITLLPLNIQASFAETPGYAAAVYHLDSFATNTDFWREVGQRTDDTIGEYDKFLNFIIPKTSAPRPGEIPLGNISDISGTAATLANNSGDPTHIINALTSKAEIAANGAFCIRFLVDHFDPNSVGTLFSFYFGQYALRVTSRGMCYLYFTRDMLNYRQVSKFKWKMDGAPINGEIYSIMIFPHARKCIEFVCGGVIFVQESNAFVDQQYAGQGVAVPVTGSTFPTSATSHLYVTHTDTAIPGGYEITKKATAKIVVSQEFRPKLQISQLVFRNTTKAVDKTGSGQYDYLWDNPMELGDPNKTSAIFGARGDVPTGCTMKSDLYEYVNGDITDHPFTTNCRRPQFGVAMVGLGNLDISGQDSCSTKTPEFYGYSIKIPPVVVMDTRTPLDVACRSITLNLLGEPESESCELVLDDSTMPTTRLGDRPAGALDQYIRRAYIPIRVYDDVTGAVYFEGYVHTVRSSVAPAQGPNTLHMQARGMADRLLRHYAINLDFTAKADATVGTFTWSEAILETFNNSGFDETKVFIAERDKYDFPLWPEADQNSSGQGGATHAPSQRWKVNPNQPIYKFMDGLIRETLGWHWEWTRENLTWVNGAWDFTTLNSHWSIFKRPRPSEIANLPVEAAFFKNQALLASFQALNPTVPAYCHKGMTIETKAPACTTIIGVTTVMGIRPDDKTVINADGSGKSDSPIDDQGGLVVDHWRNPDGIDYVQKNNTVRVANHNSPNYMGTEIQRVASLLNAGSIEAYSWIGRRVYEDLTFGSVEPAFESDWDEQLNLLSHWSKVIVDDTTCLILRAEPHWENDTTMRRAKFQLWEVFAGAAPPR